MKLRSVQGVRRIEAVSGKAAEDLIELSIRSEIRAIRGLLKNPKDIIKAIENLVNENGALKKQLEKFESAEFSRNKKRTITKS